MDRRYGDRRDHQAPAVAVSSSTLPAFGLLAFGVCICVTAFILMAAFGVSEPSSKKKQLSGPIVLVLGVAISISALIYASKLKARNRKIQQGQRALKKKPLTKLTHGRSISNSVNSSVSLTRMEYANHYPNSLSSIA